MDKTPFSKKCEIMHEFYINNANDPEWIDFFEVNDLGFPAATLSVLNAATLNAVGMQFVNDTWIELCNTIGIDYHGEYNTLQDIVDLVNA